MAATFLSTANTFLHSIPPTSPSSSCSSSSSSSSSSSTFVYPNRFGTKKPLLTVCKVSDESPPVNANLTKRGISICLIAGFASSLAGNGSFGGADAAILEADDDLELLERVKNDRKKRIERQSIINSSNKERGYLQDLVYTLSKIGQAIENNDLSTASSVLGGSTNTDWVQKANIAFTKLSYGPEEKTEVDTFNSSLASLISSVTRNDVESSKVAFVESVTAFEKWAAMTGLVGQLKGL